MSKQTKSSKYVLFFMLLMVVIGMIIWLFGRPLFSNQMSSADRSEAPAEKPSIAENVERFMREFAAEDDDEITKQYGEHVSEISNFEPAAKQLERLSSARQNFHGGFAGEYQFRSFHEGSTLRQEITRHAQAEGVALVWGLHLDYAIADMFQAESTLVDATKDIAAAVKVHYGGVLQVYFCPAQGALVITPNLPPEEAQKCRRHL